MQVKPFAFENAVKKQKENPSRVNMFAKHISKKGV